MILGHKPQIKEKNDEKTNNLSQNAKQNMQPPKKNVNEFV